MTSTIYVSGGIFYNDNEADRESEVLVGDEN